MHDLEWIADLFHNPRHKTEEEWEWILEAMGDQRPESPFTEDNSCDEEILDKYAENIRNFFYKYKKEAQNIDGRIDPEQEHIGPMAQDIEKVNPACIKETPEGIKTVDTGRLALMNAGAIAELARQIKELKNGTD